jgi:hypothetical protein
MVWTMVSLSLCVSSVERETWSIKSALVISQTSRLAGFSAVGNALRRTRVGILACHFSRWGGNRRPGLQNSF